MIRETLEVGVIVDRRAIDNPWVDHAWIPVAVLAGAPAIAPWTVLEQTSEVTRFFAGTFMLEFFGSQTGMYRDNLVSGRPSLWVSLRTSDNPPGIALQLVTADPSEGEAVTQPGTDIVETVAMPIEVQKRLAAFVEGHHVERPFIKRTRDRANPEAMAKTGPRIHAVDDAE